MRYLRGQRRLISRFRPCAKSDLKSVDARPGISVDRRARAPNPDLLLRVRNALTAICRYTAQAVCLPSLRTRRSC